MKKIHLIGMVLPLLVAVAPVSQAALCAVGDTGSVAWKGSRYTATVLKVDADQDRCYVKYAGYDDKWNEWVGADRYSPASDNNSNSSSSAYGVGDSLQVRWKGEWYPAKVIEVGDSKVKVHFNGYGSNWDEWVTPDRTRPM